MSYPTHSLRNIHVDILVCDQVILEILVNGHPFKELKAMAYKL